MTLAPALALVGAAVVAGLMNSLAGGGTLLTFPTLLAVGLGPLAANGTSTVALVPGSAAAAWGYAHELSSRRREVVALCLPSLVGGALGAFLTSRAGDVLFAKLVPWLILTATVLFVVQEPLARWFVRPAAGAPAPTTTLHLAGASAFMLLVATYGGFFGAGMGILILAALGQLGWGDVHEMNALKSVIAVCINGMATVTFILLGQVRWPFAGLMAIGAVGGGYGGARLARRMGQRAVRRAIVVIGFAMAAWMFARQL